MCRLWRPKQASSASQLSPECASQCGKSPQPHHLLLHGSICTTRPFHPNYIIRQKKTKKWVSLVRLWPRSGHQTKDSTSFCYTVSISLNSIIQDPRSYLRTVLEILNWTFFRHQCLPCLPGSKDWKLREEANHCSIMENQISNAISVNAEFSQIALESSFQNLPISAAGMPCQSDW